MKIIFEEEVREHRRSVSPDIELQVSSTVPYVKVFFGTDLYYLSAAAAADLAQFLIDAAQKSEVLHQKE